jgi:hypothetical protein
MYALQVFSGRFKILFNTDRTNNLNLENKKNIYLIESCLLVYLLENNFFLKVVFLKNEFLKSELFFDIW